MSKEWHGSKWIRKDKRLAIYLRDGLACCWCGAGVEEGVCLTLDHIAPRSQGGTNDVSNLITACKPCNSRRQDRSVVQYAFAVAAYLGTLTGVELVRDIAARTARPLDLSKARELIAARRAVPSEG